MIALEQPVVVEAPAPQQPAQGVLGVSAEDLARAERLIVANRFEEARSLLEQLERADFAQAAFANQVQFLLGLLAMHDQDHEQAIRHFRRILVNDPKAVRVRLEMGRAYFLAGRYRDAERQFLYARAGSVPEGVLANIDRFLGAIRRNKTFAFGLSVAIAPDSNLNAGPATDTVSLYGLPFQLSPDAQASSGIGLTIAANAEWSPRLGKDLQWRMGAQVFRTQFGRSEFNDMTLAAHLGPHFALGRWDINLLGTFSRRWFGDRGYSQAYGMSLDVSRYLTRRLGLGASSSVSRIEYDQARLRNGHAVSVGTSFFYTPTSSSFLRGGTTFVRQTALDRAYAFRSWQFGLSYIHEFRGGFTLGVAPAYSTIRYDRPLAAFGEARRDRQYSVQLSVLYRRLDIAGFTPRLAYTITKNHSNIALYTFGRSRFEIGLTSSF